MPALVVLILGLGLVGGSDPARAVSGLTFTRVTPFATLDSNNSCASGPNAVYLQVNVTNTSGSTLSNLTATFNGFTNPVFGGSWSITPVAQFQLDAEETATRTIPTIANGATVRLYWFINYPCWGGGGAPPAKTATFTLTVSDGVTAPQTSGALDITTRSELSANAGGQMISQNVGAGAALGQIVPVTVVYDFGNVGSGNDLGIQPAGNRSHNSGCYQLIGDDITNVTGVTGITTSDDNTLYKTGVSSGGGTNRITVVYFFKAVSTTCPGGTTINPFADMVSGAQQKYSGNMGTCSSTPCVLTSPAPTNILTLAKSVSPASLPSGGTATYTVTITNTSAFDTTLDSLTDTLPAGVTFGAIAAGSQIVAGNSASLPAAGASGTIKFVAVDASTCPLLPALSCTWVVPANGTLTLKYTVSVPNVVGSYTNSIAGKIAAEQIDTTTPTSDNAPATSTVTVGSPPSVAKSFSPNPISAGGTSTLTITLSNPNASALSGASFTDNLPSSPAQMTVVGSPSSPQCGGTVTNTATSVTLTNGTIPGGSPGTCTIVLTVTAPTAGSYGNTIPIGGLTTTSGLSNTAAGSATLVVLGPPDLSVTKSDGGASVAPGGTVAYTLTYANTGAQGATGVVLTETVPANTTFNAGASTAGWVCSPSNNAGSTCTLTIGSVAASGGGSATFAVTVTNPLPAGVTQIANTASIADDGTHGADPTPGNNSGSDTTPVTGAPDLSVTKSDGGASVAPGGTVSYTLTYSNTGNRGATGVVLTETVPANTTFNAGASTAGWVCSPNNNAGSTCTLTLGSVAASTGGSATFAVTVINPLPAGVTQIANTASIADDGANGTDPTPGNNSGSDTTPVTGAPDLSVTKSDGGASVAPGGTVSYTLTYSNTGNRGASGVVLTETVPANTTFNAGASTAGWSCTPNNNAGSTCTLAVGTVAASAGGSATFAVTVTNPLPAGVTQIANTATISDNGTNGTDPTPGNNSGSDTTPVTGAPDLSVTKSDGGASVAPGGTVSYTLTYSNTGNRGASGVVLTETVPANTTFNAGASTAGWSCSPNNNAGSTCTLAVGTVAASGSGSATFAVTVTNPLPAGVTQIANTATISDNGTNGTDPTPGNNSGGDTTPVTGAPDLSVTKTDGGASVAPGGTASYTLTYSNTGNRGATGVVLTETVPANSTFNAGASTAGWSCSPNNNAGSTCTLAIGSVAASAGSSATFAVTVSNPLPAGVTQIANTATISDDGTNGTDPTPGNNSGGDTTPVTGAPDLSVTKSDGGASVAPGSTVSYTLTYSNTGNRGAAGVVLTETVPANTTFNSGASTAGWVCAPNNNAGSTCTLAVGTVAASGGGSATFAVTVTNPLPAGVTQISNTATIADDGTNGTDPTPGNNTGGDTTPVTGAPDLSVTKSDGGASVAPGSTVSYTLTYSNTGNRGATGVVLTETVPANTTFNSGASTAGWVCAPNNNAGSTCTLAVGSVAASAGGSATFAVTVANPLAAGVTQIANTATIADDGANGTDPTPGNNTGSDTTPVTGAPDLSVAKSDGGASVAPGGTVSYTLTYSNAGNRGATGVVLTETVPANTTFNAGASTAGWSCTPNGNAGSTCTLAVGSLAAGSGNQTATFAVTVANPLPAGVTQISNTTSIADDGANGTDPTPGNNSGGDTTPVTGAPDLSVTKSDGGASVVPGGTATYTLTYSNAGNRGATGVVLTETVPANTTFNAGASTAGWSCTPNNNAGSTCTLAVGAVAAGGGSLTATFAVTVGNPLPGGVTQIANTATIADDGANGTDPTPGNNTGSDTTPVTSAPDLTVTKSDGGASVAPGGTVTYTLTYSNSGNINSTGVVLTETVPANTTFNAGASTAGWSCTPNGNAGSTCTLAIGSLAAGSGNQTATFAVTVANPLPAGVTQISNTASIADDGTNGTDPTPGNNSGSDTTPVTGAPDLTVTKSDGGASVAPGGTVSYTLTYSNAGNRGATGVVLTETVPANTTFNAASSTAGWSCTPNNNAGSVCTLTIGSLAAGGGNQTATFAVTVVNPVAAGVTQIANTATIADDGTNGTDPTPGNNTGTDTTPVTGAPDLTVTKSDGGASVTPGGTVTYTLTYSNSGNRGATGVVLTEMVPANTTFNAGSSTAGWVCTPNNNAGSTCTLAVGSVAAGGGSQTATFAVTVGNPLPGGVTQITNTATIADDGTNGTDPTPGNNTGSDTTPVTSAPDLSVTKSDGGVSVAPGGTAVYTLTYANTGNVNAAGVVLTETVPANTTFNAASSTAGWSCTPSNNAGSTCTLAIGNLAAGSGNQTATFAVTVINPVPAGVTQIANTATIADDGKNGADPTPANNTGSDTTPVSTAALLNPPVGQKTLSSSTPPNIEWRMVWINSQNSSSINVQITDAIPAGTAYVAGSVTCTPQGSSSTTTCLYDSVNNRIFWQGVIGADPGAATEAAAANEIVITFRVAVDPAVSHVENQANALTDRDGDGDFSDEDPTTSVSTSNRVVWDRAVSEIPTVSGAGLAALFLLLAAAGWLILRRGLKPRTRP
jgi:uncharacterized repeat protein (TIGR01451 family)